MPKATPTRDPQLTLQQRLAELRRRLRFVITLRAVGWLLGAVLLTVALAGLLDWRWHLPSVVRAVFLVGTLSAAGAIAYQHLLRPLSARTDNLTLALRIEEQYPGLNDALASTVQFLEQDSATVADSPGMRRQAVQQALRKVEGCDFNRVVDRRGMGLAGLSMTAGGALAAALLLLYPAQAWTALQRLANPFGGLQWPSQTQIELVEPRTRVARNELYEVRAVLRGVVPERAVVAYRIEGQPTLEHAVDVAAGDRPDVGTLLSKLEPGRVQRNFRFQVRANDAATEWVAVTVLPPPQLVPLNGRPSPQVRLQFPAYTQLKDADLPDGTGNVEAVAGTVVHLRAAADRPLTRAWVDYQPEPRFTELAAFLGSLGAGHGPAAVAATVAGQAVWEPVPAQLAADGRSLSVTFLPRVSGMYLLHFEDETHLPNHRVFELRVLPDPAPVVQLERPSPKHDSLAVLPGADLPLQVTAEDTLFAVRSVYLEYRVRRGKTPAAADEPVQRLALLDVPVVLPPPVSVPLFGPVHLARPRQQQVTVERRFALKDVRHADAARSELKEGDSVFLQACAEDFDDVSVDKPAGRSHEIEIRIVTRNELDLQLNQEQANVQQELVKLRQQQREALKKVTDAERTLRRTGKLTPEELGQLSQAEQQQQQIRERVGNKQEGLRAEVARILDALQSNKLPRTATQDRMEQVARELERLAREELPHIEPRLSNARKQSEPQADAAPATPMKDRAADQGATDPKGEQPKGPKEPPRLQEEGKKEPPRLQEEGKKGPDQKATPGPTGTSPDLQKGGTDPKGEQPKGGDPKQSGRPDQKPMTGSKAEPKPAPETKDAREKEAEAREKSGELLEQARLGQEEVEKTLNDLLARLEPWSSTREIKGEAKSILQDQQRLHDELEAMQKNLGSERQDLTPQQRAELDKAADAQQKLQDRTLELLDKMKRVSDDRMKPDPETGKPKDPDTAQELERAFKKGMENNLSGRMQTAQEQIEQNKLTNARETQRDTIERMKQLVKDLEDRREAELDRLTKKLKEAEQKLDELTAKQEELQKKLKEAGEIADPKKREEELKRLARQQQELHKQAQEMVKQLSRLRAERASQALGKALGQMEQAGQQLQRNPQEAQDQQDEALDRLDEARRELERAREEAQEELAREQLDKITDALKRLKERQEALVAEGERLNGEALRNKAWTRGLRFSLGNLARNQKGLGEECDQLAREKLTNAQVFARILQKAAQAMSAAGERQQGYLQHLAENPMETAGDAEALRLQQEALRRLTQLLDVIKPDKNGRPGGAPAGGQGGEGGEGGGGGGGGDGIPALAELKLLRGLQVEINERTEKFGKDHPDPKKLTDAEKAQLKALTKEQQEVHELLEHLTQPGADEGERP